MSEGEVIYVIGNPEHSLGFLVLSPLEPVGYRDPLKALSDLERVRKREGRHIKLYRVEEVRRRLVTKNEMKRFVEETEPRIFNFVIMDDYVSGVPEWGRRETMGVDRVEDWKRFSEHMEKYIEQQTVQKYGLGEAQEGTFDLISLTKPIVCIWNILRYSIRLWNGKGKEHDLEKIAHYAQLAWEMGKDLDRK